jgi:hypothetical protein
MDFHEFSLGMPDEECSTNIRLDQILCDTKINISDMVKILL